ncbi:transposase [Pelagicoccus sp. SDUM812005]|nr:transposase [Pelagicoccus sp. SDUM812005]
MGSKLRIRNTQALRRGRVSVPNARYFVTVCTRDRAPVLCSDEVWLSLVQQWENQELEGDMSLHCMVLMPDHLHVVFRLGARLKLGQVVGKFKSKATCLVEWQEDFFDHRLGSDEPEEPYAFYLFMNPNPYRSDLLGLDSRWKFWKKGARIKYEFEEAVGECGALPTRWVAESEKVRACFEVE